MDRYRAPAFYLGACFLFSFKGFTNGSASTEIWAPIRIIAPLLVLALCYFFYPRLDRKASLMTVALVGSLGAGMALGDASAEATKVGPQLVNFVYIVLLIAWAELYARLPMTKSIVAVAGSYVAGSALYFLLGLLPPSLIPGIACCLPIVSSLCLLASLQGVRGPSAAPSWSCDLAAIRGHFPWRLTIVAAAYAFAFGVSSNHSIIGFDMLSACIVGLTLLLLLMVFGRRESIHSVFRLALPVMMISLAAVQLLGGAGRVGWVVTSVCYGISEIITIVILCDLSHRFGVNPALSNSLMRVIIGVAFVLGGTVDAAFVGQSALGGSSVLVSAAVAIVALAASLLWLMGEPPEIGEPIHASGGDPEGQVPDSDADADAVRDAKADASAFRAFVQIRCDRISQEYLLSPREGEVLVLLGNGYSAAMVEKELCLSASTVKTHIRHIYAKLGIHSRDELRILLQHEGEAVVDGAGAGARHGAGEAS